MNQEDYQLYNELCMLRNNLQEKFYDYNNGRKPTICTEDALKLLVKYKPTSLNDMANMVLEIILLIIMVHFFYKKLKILFL